MRRLTLCLLLPFLGAFALACGDDDEPGGAGDAGAGGGDGGTGDAGTGVVAERPECENVNPHHCLLPWPSSHFLTEDATTVTGRRVALTPEMLPVNQLDEPVASVHGWNRFDGFSPIIRTRWTGTGTSSRSRTAGT